MSPLRLSLALVFGAGPALAHPGHLVEAAGHSHWVAGAAIGVAAAVLLWGLLKGRKDEAAEEAEETQDTPDEATA